MSHDTWKGKCIHITELGTSWKQTFNSCLKQEATRPWNIVYGQSVWYEVPKWIAFYWWDAPGEVSKLYRPLGTNSWMKLTVDHVSLTWNWWTTLYTWGFLLVMNIETTTCNQLLPHSWHSFICWAAPADRCYLFSNGFENKFLTSYWKIRGRLYLLMLIIRAHGVYLWENHQIG